MMEFVSYMLYFFAAIGILFGLVSLSVLLFYAKKSNAVPDVDFAEAGRQRC